MPRGRAAETRRAEAEVINRTDKEKKKILNRPNIVAALVLYIPEEICRPPWDFGDRDKPSNHPPYPRYLPTNKPDKKKRRKKNWWRD